MARWASYLVGDLQFPAGVDDIGGQSVQLLDFWVSATLTQVLGGDIPEGIPTHHGMNPVFLILHRSVGIDRGINGGAVIGEYKTAIISN